MALFVINIISLIVIPQYTLREIHNSLKSKIINYPVSRNEHFSTLIFRNEKFQNQKI